MDAVRINGQPVEVNVIGPDGQPLGAALAARELAMFEAADQLLRGDASFNAAWPDALLERVDVIRELEASDPRYYLCYRIAGGTREFWAHLDRAPSVDLQGCLVGVPASATEELQVRP